MSPLALLPPVFRKHSHVFCFSIHVLFINLCGRARTSHHSNRKTTSWTGLSLCLAIWYSSNPFVHIQVTHIIMYSAFSCFSNFFTKIRARGGIYETYSNRLNYLLNDFKWFLLFDIHALCLSSYQYWKPDLQHDGLNGGLSLEVYGDTPTDPLSPCTSLRDLWPSADQTAWNNLANALNVVRHARTFQIHCQSLANVTQTHEECLSLRSMKISNELEILDIHRD